MYVSKHLNSHEAIKKQLGQLKFIPVRKVPQNWSFEWSANLYKNPKASKKCNEHKKDTIGHSVEFFECASKTVHSECQNILGTVSFIFENNVCHSLQGSDSEKALKALGMKYKQDVSWKSVLEHLDNVITTCNRQRLTDYDFTRGIMQDIYAFLEGTCSEHLESLSSELLSQRCVYVSERFVLPLVITKETLPVKCHPHLYQLDETILKSFPTLVKCMKITNAFSPHALATIVHTIKRTQGNKPLSEPEIHAVLNLLICLKAAMIREKSNTIITVYGPDENGHLQDCKSMCFNDFDDIEKSDSMIFAHKMLPPEIAEFFGVLPKRLRFMEEHSEDIEDFYQNEPLVVRLRRILEGSPETGLFKELIQNADDAEATEICFIRDYVYHNSEKDRDSEFEHALGPSLCIFNNSAFSKNDLEAITKLGQGNKADDSVKTGYYGIGFNAVYNLTDAPSFYTCGGDIEHGETLCYFDPLASFYPLVTREKPGKRIKNMKAIRGLSGDIMKSYHETLIPKGGKGTVFRLPLRTKGSEIKDEPITQESLDKLLESLSKELRDIVVFLKHLKCVRIVTNTSTGYKEDYRINVVMDGANTAVRDKIYRNFKDLGKVARESIFQYPQHTDLYTMSLHENQMKTGPGTQVTDFLVAMTVGFKKNAPFSEKLCNKFKKGKIKMIPFGGVAVGVKNKQNPKEILQRVSRSRDSRNPVFCFLPLPITTPLPVLVNGYFALDTETRQNLSGSGNTDEDRWRTHWNKLIIEKVISSAYIKLLDYTKNEIFGHTGITDRVRNPVLVHKAIGNFQEFFPVTDGLSEYWKMLACSVFSELIEEKIPFLPMQDTFANMFAQTRSPQCKLTWTSLYSSGCIYPAYVNSESVNHGTPEGNVRDHSKLNHLLRRAGMRIVYVNDKIIKSMEDTGKPILSLTPVNTIDFLCSWSKEVKDKCKIKPGENVLCTLQSVKETCTVLEYCLENVVHFLQNIMDIPLFVTETLQVLSLKDVEPRFVDKSGKYCTFFKSKTELFVHREIAALLEEKCGERMFECQKLRRFHLDDFVKLASLTKAIQTNCRAIVPWDGFNPSKEWIHQFWDFFENELKAKTHLANVVDGMKKIEMIPIIPATVEGNTTGFLVPYADRNRIINLESFQSKHQLHAGLSKMNLHVINRELFHDVNSEKNELFSVYDKLSEIIPNLQNPLGVLECLFLHLENVSDQSIGFEDTDAILHFFNEGLGNDGRLLNDELLEKLKKMPLFKSHFNKLVKLCDYEHIHVVPDELRPEGLEEIADQVNVLFLSNCHLKNLFKRLKISELAMADVYVKYIIPNQAKLRRASFYRHLEFLSSSEYAHDDTNSGSNTLLKALKNTKFVERTDHEFVKVDSLYDPYHPVFITMCDKNELVPKILRKQRLVKLFRKLGLHTEMTIELYERFATDIATKGIDNGLSSDVMKKSKLLVQHLLQMKDSFIKKVDFTNLSNIKFVVPGKVSEELSLMHGQFNVDTLIPFHGSVLSDRGGNENISWTVCNILPHFDSITSELVRRLKICEHPDIPTIIKHLTNVGKSVDELITRELCTSAVQGKASSVFHDIYQALSGHKNYTSHQWQKIDTPVINSPEMKMVLPPKMVVLSCKVDAEDVPPYFCKCPNEYGMFHDLFVKLGANKQPECSSYSGVLHRMKTKQGETHEQLTGKDLEDATKATGYFLKLTSQSSGPINVGADSLFLLSKQETLENAKCLIVSNNKFFEEQILKNGVAKSKFLAGLDLLSRFNLSTDSIVNCLSRLPETHRPHLLTDIVHEQVILENIKNKDGKIAKHLESFIQGHHFIHGVLRLVCHVRKCQSKEFSEVERNKIIASLRKISCRHCSDIKTIIAMRSIENQQLGPFRHIKNTEEVRYVHLEKTEAGACIYFDTDDRQWVGSVQKSLTLYLNKEKGLGLLDEYQMRLEEIIALYRAPFNVDRHLSKHKIDDYPYQFENTETPKVPIVGNYVPVELHQYLVNNFEDISESEYKFMALEIDDPFYYLDDDERCVQTFIYVHIIRKMQPISSLHLLQEYEIDDGSEQFKVVRAHKLYKITNRPTEWENPTDTTSSGNQDLKGVCKEIKDLLKDAWKQPVNERKSIVKRLLFKWHPDKNPDKVDFCTKVFQFIQQCIFALENGKDLPNEENENENTGTRTPPPKSPGSFNSWSDGFWSRYRSRQQRSNRERKERPSRERTEHGPNAGNFWTFHESSFRERQPYPCFLEARHWLAQAGYDLKDAKIRLRQPGTAFNWVCYQAYQAAEKALVAAWYAVDAYKADIKKYSKSLSFIAAGLGPRLESLVARLESEVWSCRRMLYPSHYGIPQDLYNKDKAEKAIAISETIVKNVQDCNNIL